MPSTYHEPELTQPVNLCDSHGNLNPAAVGWSRHPLHHCNLKGHWPRKKRWNYWAIVSPTHLFSVTLSDIDYLGLPFIYLLDFETKTFTEKTLLKPFGAGCYLPAGADGDVVYQDPAMPISMLATAAGTHLTIGCPDFGGKPLTADFHVHQPAGHETLNVVIPWSSKRFQFTSKQNTLPTEGTLQWGDETIHFNPKDTFACLDLGRGMWPFTCFWNWSSFSTRLTDGRTVGVNLGAGWTDGTGMNENALCVDGVLTKISEDLFFDYNTDDFMAPWHLHTSVTDRVDLKFTPFYERVAKTDALVIRSEVHQMIGHFTGTLKPDQGEPIDIKNALGWAEDHHARW
ncbi:MAG: DUF2804 domain-containing protein [Brevefilum sp.]|nr:DUF2804 domain-containing protein [Brevefilum sp.]